MPNLEPMENLSDEAKALLELEKNRPDDPRIPIEELTRRLSNTLSFPNLNDIAPKPTFPAAKTFALKHLVSQAALVLTGTVIGGVSVYGVMSSRMPAQEAVSPVPAETRVMPPETQIPEINQPLPIPAAVDKPVPEKKTARPIVALDAENLLIEQARTAFLRKTFDAALEAVTKHEKQFPRGNLAEERDALRVQILAAMGRRAEARLRATEFKEKYPESLLLPVVQPSLPSQEGLGEGER